MSSVPVRPPFSPVVSLLTVAAVWEARLDAELRALGPAQLDRVHRDLTLVGGLDTTSGALRRL